MIETLNESWISASKPPKERGLYLTTVINAKGKKEVFIVPYKNGCWMSLFGDIVIAWQLLPKPYKED